jgi:ATP-dependent RNA helicase DeaD
MNDVDRERASTTGSADKLDAGISSSSVDRIVEPENALPEVALAGLPEKLREAATRMKWSSLMPVQARTIPYILAGRDLMVQSRTGSGKTGAFLLPILNRINVSKSECQALILVPTRELAQQVIKEAETMASAYGVRTVAVYGGVGYGPQLEAFRAGAHLVIGTPGRILDHLLRRSLTLGGLKILVFDEADRMLSMGFYPDMKRVREFLPRRRINGYMFSATYPSFVLRLAGEFLHQPDTLSLSRDHVHVTETEHVYYEVPAMEKDRCLVRIIELENPASAIVFCNTKAMVHYVSVVLQRFGYDADELSADLTQSAREKVMGRLRDGSLRFLAATDLAARGIDIPELSHVIDYEVPEDPEAYIHRAGRTGRAGATGVAITLAAGHEVVEIIHIAERYGIDLLQRSLPSEEEVQKIVSERVVTLLEARVRSRDSLQVERMQRFMPLAEALAEDESQLVAMLLDDYYQQILHAPPERPAADQYQAPERIQRKPRKSQRPGKRRRKRK